MASAVNIFRIRNFRCQIRYQRPKDIKMGGIAIALPKKMVIKLGLMFYITQTSVYMFAALKRIGCVVSNYIRCGNITPTFGTHDLLLMTHDITHDFR